MAEQTFKASGPGGQHRNKTASAVRLTHLPTGLSVTATEDRSQHVNREVAWSRLTARLAEVAEREATEAINAAKSLAFGKQREWTWCGWRDEVVAPDGQRRSMRQALAGRL